MISHRGADTAVLCHMIDTDVHRGIQGLVSYPSALGSEIGQSSNMPQCLLFLGVLGEICLLPRISSIFERQNKDKNKAVSLKH